MKRGDLPQGVFRAGSGLYRVCWACEKVVRINKPIVGSIHICLTELELQAKRQALKGWPRR